MPNLNFFTLISNLVFFLQQTTPFHVSNMANSSETVDDANDADFRLCRIRVGPYRKYVWIRTTSDGQPSKDADGRHDIRVNPDQWDGGRATLRDLRDIAWWIRHCWDFDSDSSETTTGSGDSDDSDWWHWPPGECTAILLRMEAKKDRRAKRHADRKAAYLATLPLCE